MKGSRLPDFNSINRYLLAFYDIPQAQDKLHTHHSLCYTDFCGNDYPSDQLYSKQYFSEQAGGN